VRPLARVAPSPGAMLIALLLPLALLARVAGAQAPPPLTRDQALAQIGAADAKTRRHAADWLGEVGAMSDAPVLARALRDRDEGVRAMAEASLWQLWSRSGDAQIDAQLQQGIEQMSRRDATGAIETFTRIIERKPEFAEGWNKRATIYFLVGEYDKSLRDCDEVMRRNPLHFGALAGYGQIYLRLGQPEKALEYFDKALAVNPNMDGVEAMARELREQIAKRRRDTTEAPRRQARAALEHGFQRQEDAAWD
jgi:tetratricopeptide (TPR) repeat protein